jgi:8-oxo-dGTP pyrophosphatase MutT (NUDIX family)
VFTGAHYVLLIAGEIEPGEDPAEAAVREVKEEMGLRVRATGVIGRRVHPDTGRDMVYLAARPTQGNQGFCRRRAGPGLSAMGGPHPGRRAHEWHDIRTRP